jgi:hypothetical protein
MPKKVDTLSPETGFMRRIGSRAGFGVAAIGLVFAAYQVQGWKMPRLLAAALIASMLAVAGIALLSIVWEVISEVRGWREHRATHASWVSAEPPGKLDYEADGLRAQERFTRELLKQAKETHRLGKKLARYTKRIGRRRFSGPRRRQRQANRSAKSIERGAVFIEKRVELLKALVKDVERNYQGYISIAVPEVDTEAEFQAAMELRNSLESGRATTAETLRSASEYRESIKELETQNLSRTVRIASGRLEKAQSGIVAVLRSHERATAGIIREFDKKLAEQRRQ